MANLYEFSKIPRTASQTVLSQFFRRADSCGDYQGVTLELVEVRSLHNVRVLTGHYSCFLNYSTGFLGEDYCVVPVFLKAFFEKPFMLDIFWSHVSPSDIDQVDITNTLMFLRGHERCDKELLEPRYTIKTDDSLVLGIYFQNERVFTFPERADTKNEFSW